MKTALSFLAIAVISWSATFAGENVGDARNVRNGVDGADGADGNDWVSYYYRNPSPDRFVKEVTKLSKAGRLANPKSRNLLAVFLGQVMAANPASIDEWMKSLENLPDKDKKTLLYAVWLSNTKEARRYLEKIGATKALKTDPINVLDIEPTSPGTLDMYWAYFFATGDSKAIRKIISAFNHSKHAGALKAYTNSLKSEEDKRKAKLEAVFLAAKWSLGSNIKQHKKVAEICEELHDNGSLNSIEKKWLGTVLTKVMLDKPKRELKEGG
jgi:hypothetical protein